MDTLGQHPSLFTLSARRIRFAAMGITNDNGMLLRKAREAHRLTQSELGSRLDPKMTKQQVYKLEAGLHRITAAVAAQLGEILGLNPADLADEAFIIGKERRRGDLVRVAKLVVIGRAQAGTWAEPELFESAADEMGNVAIATIPVVPDDRFDLQRQYALQLEGASLNRVAPPGSYVICVNIEAFPGGLDERRLDGKLVHVERHRGDLVETTVKRFKRAGATAELWPDSDDPKHKTPIRWEKNESIRIVGVVVAKFIPE